MSGLSAPREPGVSRMNGTPVGRRVGEELRERLGADVALADPLVPVLEGAAHVHRVVGVHQPQPAGPADLDDPVDGRGRAAGLVQRRAGREDVAGVEADPGLRVEVEGVEVGRQVLDAGAQGAALAGGRLEQQPRRGVVGDRVEQRAAAPRAPAASPRRSCVRARPGRRVDERPGVHDDALGADLGGALEVVGDRGDRVLVRRGGGRAEVDEVGRVDEDPRAALGHQVAEAGVVGGLPGAQRPAARVADEDLERLAAELVGVGDGAVDEALADQDVGADRVAEPGSRTEYPWPARSGRVGVRSARG